MFCYRFFISILIFIIYIINVINGLNIDSKALAIAFNLLIEKEGFIRLINIRFGIGMHYLDNVDGNLKNSKSSMSNNIFAVTGNNDNDNINNDNPNNNEIMPNQGARSPSPVPIDNPNNNEIVPEEEVRSPSPVPYNSPKIYSDLDTHSSDEDYHGGLNPNDEGQKLPADDPDGQY